MLKRRAFWPIAIVLMLGMVAGAIVLNKRSHPATGSASAPVIAQTPVLEFLPTDVSTVGPRDLRQTLPLSGSLRAVNQAVVKARVSGEVREVLVREGEAVKAGQILVRMDAGEYQARLEQAGGALQAARGQAEMATKTRNNNKALLEKGFISQNAFDNASSQYDIAQANMASARAALDVAQKSLNDTVIHAPIAGLVSSRSVQPGEKVSPDNRLLELLDLRRMEMEAAVPASDIMRIAQGQDVELSVEGLPHTLPGKVARINPAIQAGSRSIPIYIQIDNPQGMLRSGLFAQAQLTLAKKSGVLAVPQSAIRTEAGKPVVYAIENGRLMPKSVQLGIKGDDSEGDAVEVLGGLESGARIVRGNLGNLQAGTQVRVIASPLPSAPAVPQ